MRIALASPPIPDTLKSGINFLEKMVKDASEKNADIICFPESYLPGYPGMGYSTKDRTSGSLEAALKYISKVAQLYSIAIIAPMDWYSSVGLQNVAFVISKEGEILGKQTKNQLDPTEDEIWIAGTDRQLFEVKGVKFGITICHEGFRYPESVRWAAQNGAKIVFHPQFTANTESGKQLTEWGHKDNPYYEKAMMMRAIENTIYFASVNYASNYSESATSIINPNGNCIAHQNYGEAGIIVADIDPEQATGLLAKRFKNHLY